MFSHSFRAPATPSPAPVSTPAASTPASAPAENKPAAATPTTPAASTPAATPAAAPAAAGEEVIARIMELGFPRDHVVRALEVSWNNPDRAVEILMMVCSFFALFLFA